MKGFHYLEIISYYLLFLINQSINPAVMINKKNASLLILLVAIVGLLLFSEACNTQTSTPNHMKSWKDITESRIQEYGHRNWIVIADAAYPAQSAPGIETVVTNARHMEVVDFVLDDIANSTHVQPIVMVDKELNHLKDNLVPGIEDFRSQLEKRLGIENYRSMLHEEIIHKLDEASELVNVLILKTNMTMPYTSVFIELDCGYWNGEKESELRSSMKIAD